MKKCIINKFLLSILMFFLIFPLIILIIWSVSKIYPWPNLIPKEFGLRGFKYIFNLNNNSLKVLLFSVLLSIVVTIVTLIISIPASKALGLYDFKGKRFIKLLILAPIIVPPIAVTMGIHITFIKLKLANTFSGVVLVHLIPCIPYGVRILTNVFEIIGDDLEMQAKVLGANKYQTFFSITLPLISPGIISASAMIFIISFSQYLMTLLIGGGKIITFSILMFPYIQSGDRMMASVHSIFFVGTTLVVLYAMEKITKLYYNVQNDFFIS